MTPKRLDPAGATDPTGATPEGGSTAEDPLDRDGEVRAAARHLLDRTFTARDQAIATLVNPVER